MPIPIGDITPVESSGLLTIYFGDGCLLYDGNIFIASRDAEAMVKVSATDYTTVATSSWTYASDRICQTGLHIYMAGLTSGGWGVKKVLASDLSAVGYIFPDDTHDTGFTSICTDGTWIYAGGYGLIAKCKLDGTEASHVHYAVDSSHVHAMIWDGADHIYMATNNPFKIYKINISDLSTDASVTPASITTCDDDMIQDAGYIYITAGNLLRFTKDDNLTESQCQLPGQIDGMDWSGTLIIAADTDSTVSGEAYVYVVDSTTFKHFYTRHIINMAGGNLYTNEIIVDGAVLHLTRYNKSTPHKNYLERITLSDILPQVTENTLPDLTTQAVSEITMTTATGNATQVSTGGGTVTDRGICWAASPNKHPKITNGVVHDEGTGNEAFTGSITGLTLSTTYYVRPFCTNEEGTVYGPVVSFETDPASVPTVTTSAAASVGINSAILAGEVSSNGGATVDQVGFDWGVASGVYTEEELQSGEFTTFSDVLTGLTANTVIFFRAKGHNSSGWGYGDEVSFTTLPISLSPVNGSRMGRKMFLKLL